MPGLTPNHLEFISAFDRFLTLFLSVWNAERQRGETASSSIHWFLSKWLQKPRLGQPEARSQKLHLDLSLGWQGPKDLAVVSAASWGAR